MPINAAIILTLSLAAMSAGAPDTDRAGAEERIEAVSRTEPSVVPTQGALLLTSRENETQVFQIYSITGQLVRNVKVSGSTERVELRNGCYVVRVGRWSKKVIIK